VIGNALLVLLSVAIGWVALWPARRVLGPWGYHLAALPVGLLGWTFAGFTATLVALPMGPVLTMCSVAVYCGLVFAALARLTRSGAGEGPRPFPAWTFAVAGGTVLAVTAAATVAGLTVYNYDSWSYYHVFGVGLAKAGDISPLMMGARSTLIPSVIAAGQLLGGDWIYAVYPVMAANLVALVLRLAWLGGVGRLGRKAGAALLAALGLALVTLPSFLFHAVFVHSQLYSALYLLLATGAIVAVGVADEQGAPEGGPRALALLLLGGLATAGFALSRPDGLAYMFAPMLLVAAMRFRGWSRERLAAYFLPLIAVLAVNYFPAYLRLHFWASVKLSGRFAFAILVAATAFPVVVEMLASWDRAAWLRKGPNAMRLALAVSAGLVVLAALIRPSTFAASVSNMLTNLLSTGGYGLLWPFLIGSVAVTVAFGALRRGEALAEVASVIAEFFLIALVVHGLEHPGRLSPGDSFNRIVFHVVPLALCYLALAVAGFARRGPAATGGGVAS